MSDAPQDMPLQPEPGETIVWGAVREAPRSPTALDRFLSKYIWWLYAALWAGILAINIAAGRISGVLLGAAIGVSISIVLLPFRPHVARFRQKRIESAPHKVTARWLTRERLVVEPANAPFTDRVYSLDRLSNPKLDYELGSPVVVVDIRGGQLVLRTIDARGLHSALEPLLFELTPQQMQDASA